MNIYFALTNGRSRYAARGSAELWKGVLKRKKERKKYSEKSEMNMNLNLNLIRADSKNGGGLA